MTHLHRIDEPATRALFQAALVACVRVYESAAGNWNRQWGQDETSPLFLVGLASFKACTDIIATEASDLKFRGYAENVRRRLTGVGTMSLAHALAELMDELTAHTDTVFPRSNPAMGSYWYRIAETEIVHRTWVELKETPEYEQFGTEAARVFAELLQNDALRGEISASLYDWRHPHAAA